MKFDVTNEVNNGSGYCWEELTIDMENESDIRLRFPSGKEIVLQYRLEAPSIDVCMPDNEDTSVVCWEGCDMKPAPQLGSHEHVRKCGQIVIDINPEWVDEVIE